VAENTSAAEQLMARLKDWEQFYSRYGDFIRGRITLKDTDATRAQMALNSDAMAGEETLSEADREEAQEDRMDLEEEEEEEEPEEERASDEYQMVIVDVVIIRTEENIKTRKGVNLLNGLMLQFGSESAPAYSRGRHRQRRLRIHYLKLMRAVVV